jgi:hypothetical protein
MSTVGAFPTMGNIHRRTIRAQVNPLDKSTVISIYPRDIDEVKHTIQPGRFFIPAGTYEKPSILIVGPSSWWRELDDEQPLLEIPVSSIQIADSVVRDYCNGLLACDMADVMPGLFFIPGEVKEIELKTRYKSNLDKARENQKRWYATLVRMGDTLWSRSNGNPLAVSDDMRLAARELGLNTKEWLQDFQAMETIRCVACGSMRNPLFPICPNCKAVIDIEAAKKLNLKFVE